MKRRIAIWAGVGFLVAVGWVLYTFLASPEQVLAGLREPIVQALAYGSCPLIFAARQFPIHFWWVPPINAATYVLIGLIAEAFVALTRLRHRSHGLAA
jgi:hypothetical protein